MIANALSKYHSKLQKKNFIYKNSLVLLITWWAVIFILCATPGHFIPSVHWLEMLSFDKWVHAGMFLVLIALFFMVNIKHKQKKALIYLYVVLGVFYGMALEWMQANLFSNRSADWQDIIANTFGCLIALLAYKKIKTYFPEATV